MADWARMHRVPASDEVRRMVRPLSQQYCHIGIELIDKGHVFFGGYLLQSIGKPAQRFVPYVFVRVRPFVLNWLRCQKGNARAMRLEHARNFRLAAHIGAEDVLTESLISMIVHAEFNCYECRFER